MNVKKVLCLGSLVGTLTAALASDPAWAEYPERPVRVVIGYAPGGGTDIMARIIADELSKQLGQGFLVENKPGGATTLAASLVASAPADGYTVLLTTLGTAIASSTMDKLPYDYVNDLKGIAMIATNDFVMVVPKDSPISDLADLVRLGQAEGISYSSSGINSPSHLITDEILRKLGVEGNHVPYSGSGEALTAVLSGEVELNLSVTANAAPVLRDGLVKGLAITSVTGNPQVPEMRPLDQLGLEGYEGVTWYGMFGPADLPDEITTRLSNAIRATLEVDAVSSKLVDYGYTLNFASPEAFQAFSLAEVDRWKAAAAAAAE